MTTGTSAMLRALLLVMPVVSLLLVPATAGPTFTLGSVAVLLVAVAVTLACVRRNVATQFPQIIEGLSGDERQLRGSFRRQTRLDAPGRVRPRAPGLAIQFA
ncbi:DUF6412 domain-containing protein [Millisia brevis]|uniref:DUF6412 domain-containing protein n=1 Tax=Millisia brevis TaxID=264148 RepID=UPI0012ED95C7|nr:DUF6412 domain-containing protein [Millisia brevis]